MRILVLDYHVGCVAATAATLRALGHEVQILSLSDHSRYLRNIDLNGLEVRGKHRRDLLRRLQLGASLQITRNGLRKRVADITRAVDEPIGWSRADCEIPYDIAWLHFPPAMYRRVLSSRIARNVVVHVSHRFDLWIADPKERERFHKQMSEDIEVAAISVFAANDFDRSYIQYYLGQHVEVLPPYFPYLEQEGRPARQEPDLPALIGPANVQASSLDRFLSGEHIWKADGRPLTIRETYKTYDFSDLKRHEAFLMWPYSVYSISMSELAALGRPLLLPTNQWLQLTKQLNDVSLWPKYAAREQIQMFRLDQKPDSPNASAVRDEWLDAASWHTFPNIRYWNDLSELSQLLSEAREDPSIAVEMAQSWQEEIRKAWQEVTRQLEHSLTIDF